VSRISPLSPLGAGSMNNLQSQGAGGVNVNVQNYGNDNVAVQQSGSDIEIIIGRIANDVLRGGSNINRAFEGRYGVSPSGGAY